jgi:hypothetical protein
MKPRAGPIQEITDNAGASGGVGFVLNDDKGLPFATFAISTVKRHKGRYATSRHHGGAR